MSEAQTMTRDEVSAMIATRAWKDDAFRARVLADANAVYEEETNSKLPPGVKLKVIEDDANTVHFVIPAKPANTDELSDDELEAVAGGATPAVAATIGATVAVAGLTFKVVNEIGNKISRKRW